MHIASFDADDAMLALLRRFSRPIQALAHFLAGLEERHRLLFDRNMGAGARVATHAGGSVLHREGAEAAQLDAVPPRHGGNDLPENSVDDVLHVTLVEVRVLRSNTLHQLGFDHRAASPVSSFAGFRRKMMFRLFRLTPRPGGANGRP